jgi:hypothetical protein
MNEKFKNIDLSSKSQKIAPDSFLKIPNSRSMANSVTSKKSLETTSIIS